MALKGYHSYRGRQATWRVVGIVALVLVLLAACTFLFLQRFLTYADDGTYYLDLPTWHFSGRETEEQEGQKPEQNVNLVIDRVENNAPGNTRNESESPAGEQDGVTYPAAPLRLVELSEIPQDEEALTQMLSRAGADGFVFTAKNAAGKVSFPSAVARPEAVSEDVVSREWVSRMCARDGLYTVARISCFRDPFYAYANMETAGVCQTSGYIWYDYDMGHWLDPEKEAARRYVIDLALECAQLGFDELMLENVCYPSHGKLYKIDYSANALTKTEALVQFITQLRTELEPYGVRLSLLASEAALCGTAEDAAESGFSAQELLPLVDAVYAVTADAAGTQRAMAALAGDTVPPLIPIVTDETAEGSWYWVPEYSA